METVELKVWRGGRTVKLDLIIFLILMTNEHSAVSSLISLLPPNRKLMFVLLVCLPDLCFPTPRVSGALIHF